MTASLAWYLFRVSARYLVERRLLWACPVLSPPGIFVSSALAKPDHQQTVFGLAVYPGTMSVNWGRYTQGGCYGDD